MTRIGVTPSGRTEKDWTVHADYMQSVLRADALPLLLPLTTDKKALDAALDAMDGLLVTGGADVAPAFYGEEELPLCGETDPERDDMEAYCIRRALAKNLPLLCVCRGMQLMNCVLGGTLYQDIAAQMGTQVFHPDYAHPDTPVHPVAAVPGSLLARCAGETEFSVNSRHHQGVRRLGDGLSACAKAPDGLIEAIECPDRFFALGVQWHPESLSVAQLSAKKLFAAFVSACAEAKASH